MHVSVRVYVAEHCLHTCMYMCIMYMHSGHMIYVDTNWVAEVITWQQQNFDREPSKICWVVGEGLHDETTRDKIYS